MFDFNYAFDEYDEKYAELSPVELIKRMYEATGPDGKLIVPDHPYRIGAYSKSKKWLLCSMDWTEEDCSKAAAEFDYFYSALSEIAQNYPRLGILSIENEEFLSPDALEVWRLYHKDLCEGLFEKDIEMSIDRLIDEWLYPVDDEWTGKRRRRPKVKHAVDRDPVDADERIFIYWSHVSNLRSNIRIRYGKGRFAFDRCIRLKRLFYLLAFEAPEELIEREAKRFAKYIVLDAYCTDHREFELYTGYALPLTGIRNVSLMTDILGDADLYEITDPYSLLDREKEACDSIYYMKAEKGEEVMDAFDSLGNKDPACEVIARHYYRHELNPEKIDFYGLEAAGILSGECSRFLYYPAEPAFEGDTLRSDLTEEEILGTLRRIANDLEIDPALAGKYNIPF